jgi:predicted negative regulator of RcsB-dependent stress response
MFECAVKISAMNVPLLAKEINENTKLNNHRSYLREGGIVCLILVGWLIWFLVNHFQRKKQEEFEKRILELLNVNDSRREYLERCIEEVRKMVCMFMFSFVKQTNFFFF